MFQTALQILIMFVLTIGLMRLMGKSSIVQLTPYDLVAIIIVGTIVAEPLISSDFVPSIVRVMIVVGFYLIFAKLSLNQIMNKFLLGEPSILIKHGQIVEDILEREHISLIQLLSILRTAGYSKLTEIDFAILEPTGSISVIPVPAARPVTLADLDIEGQYEGIPMALIIDGTVQKRNLKLVDKDERWLQDQLIEEGIDNIKDIIYAFIDDQSEELHYSLRNKVSIDTLNENQEKIREQDDDSETEHSKRKGASHQRSLDRKIYLMKDNKLQLEGLQEAHITKSQLLEILERENFDEIEEVVLQQKVAFKSKSE